MAPRLAGTGRSLSLNLCIRRDPQLRPLAHRCGAHPCGCGHFDRVTGHSCRWPQPRRRSYRTRVNCRAAAHRPRASSSDRSVLRGLSPGSRPMDPPWCSSRLDAAFGDDVHTLGDISSRREARSHAVAAGDRVHERVQRRLAWVARTSCSLYATPRAAGLDAQAHARALSCARA